MHRTDYHPLKSYRLKALFVEREGLCEYNVQNLCCLYVGFIFLSYRYQGAVYQLRFAPHRVPEEHGAVFLELRSGLRL